MKITMDLNNLSQFHAWSGGRYVYDEIIKHGRGRAFVEALEEFYGAMTDDHLNNLLWFRKNWCLKLAGLPPIDDEED